MKSYPRIPGLFLDFEIHPALALTDIFALLFQPPCEHNRFAVLAKSLPLVVSVDHFRQADGDNIYVYVYCFVTLGMLHGLANFSRLVSAPVSYVLTLSLRGLRD